ncbi:RAD51L2 [Lepeophtheirus salmonis]|uniref:RAD51L2 n=1 Tax=Lepeophtheirus salmonis TaxID=72036 RepID=A0A7R8D3G2_LEPSM|nr:RAD51L2 [Lepeophtheirus salmonis]CAF2984508.1 RAD51L2 [Lepeophtheirus salmonis]
MSLSQPLRSFPSLKDFYELLESYGCYTLEDALDRISIFKNKTELSKILNAISNAPKPWKKSITNNYTSPNTLKRKSVVLLTNQMTTQIIMRGSYSVDTAALGENWSHSCAAKVHLDFSSKTTKKSVPFKCATSNGGNHSYARICPCEKDIHHTTTSRPFTVYAFAIGSCAPSSCSRTASTQSSPKKSCLINT